MSRAWYADLVMRFHRGATFWLHQLNSVGDARCPPLDLEEAVERIFDLLPSIDHLTPEPSSVLRIYVNRKQEANAKCIIAVDLRRMNTDT